MRTKTRAQLEHRVTDCCGFDYSHIDVMSRAYAIAHKDFHVMAVTNTPPEDIAALDAAIHRRRPIWNAHDPAAERERA